MAQYASITCDVSVDFDTRRAYPMTLGNPPEEEGDTCGALYFSDRDPDADAVDIITGPPGPQGEPGPPGTPGTNGTDGQDGADGADGSVIPNGYFLELGDVSSHGDGDFSDGAVALEPDMSVTEAVDRINEVLGLLTPSQPPAFPNATALTVSNTAGASPRLASGVTNNSGSTPPAAGALVNRITTAGVSSNTFSDVGPGNDGTVSLLVNGAVVGSCALTGTGDGGTYSGLVIADQKAYPLDTPGFWTSIDISASAAAVSVGVNKFQITHSAAGDTSEVFVVRDEMTSMPVISSGSIVKNAPFGVDAYSSGIPHCNTGYFLNLNLSVSNLAGETYYGGTDAVTYSAPGGFFASVTASYANLVSTPIARQTTSPTALETRSVEILQNVTTASVVQATARNVNGASSTTNLGSTIVLVKRGAAPANKIDENSVVVSGLGSSPNANNAARVGGESGDTPAASTVAWDSTASPETHEATVVGGVLKHDQIDYTSGYIPAGPDLSSGRSGAQYVTFSFKRTAVSAFKINVTGAYSGCWIKLPGVSDDDGISPNADNGWWDAFASYDGAGVPGEAGDTAAGCAFGSIMSGASGVFQITFGTQSSTNSTGNEILVRIRLDAGESITALSFTN